MIALVSVGSRCGEKGYLWVSGVPVEDLEIHWWRSEVVDFEDLRVYNFEYLVSFAEGTFAAPALSLEVCSAVVKIPSEAARMSQSHVLKGH